MNSTEQLLVAAAALLLTGAVVCFGKDSWRTGLWIQVTGIASIGIAAVPVLVGGSTLGAPFTSGVHPSLGLDRLSAFFVVMLVVVGIPVLIYATRSLAGTPGARLVAALTGVFLASLGLVLVARDITTFLAGWELMTLVPATAMLAARRDRPVRRATFVYLAVTHLGGVGVWVALLLLSSAGAIGSPAALESQGAWYMGAVWIAALIGFGTKAGLMPFHSWLPRAHPVAPAHLSALMSGVMIKVALYGLIRVLFDWSPVPNAWLGVVVLVIGGLSAAGGVLFALFQHDLKRLLAFHSIENVGIITLGLGASLLLARAGATEWAAIAFGAALLHTLNHAIFKALLFMGAGAIERAAHGHDLDRLGGLLRLMPWTGGAFFAGSMAIAGLPPLNGFASEWLTLQALLHIGYWRGGSAVAGPLAAAVLGATAAMAVFCFVKVVGLVLLGRPRSAVVAAATEVAPEMRWTMAFLATLCVVLGLVPGLVLPVLTAIRAPQAAGGGLALALPGTGSLPTITIALVLALVGALLVLGRRSPQTVAAPTWAGGEQLEPSFAWTSSGFTETLRLGLGRWTVVFDARLPQLVRRRSLAAARRARRLQSGSLRGYALYLAVMVALLLAGVRAGWLR